MSRCGVLLAALVLSTGCELVGGIDDRHLETGSDDGSGGSGASSGGGASVGGAGGMGVGGGVAGSGGVATGGSGGSGQGGGGGGMPAVLVSVEKLSSGDGDVLTCEIGGSCTLLDPTGLSQQPMALTWLPPNSIVVASRSQVQSVNASNGGIEWTAGVAQDLPADIFPLTTSNGTVVVAAYEQVGVSQIRNLYGYDTSGNETDAWMLNDGTFPLGLSWTSMTQQPSAPAHLYALRQDASARREVNPENNSIIDAGPTTGLTLRTIHAIHDGNRLRVAWVGGSSDVSVYYRSGAGAIAGPIACQVGAVPCTFEHAVPDPTSDDHYFALCSDSGAIIRQLVRLGVGDGPSDACEVIYDGTTLGTGWRLSKLAIRP